MHVLLVYKGVLEGLLKFCLDHTDSLCTHILLIISQSISSLVEKHVIISRRFWRMFHLPPKPERGYKTRNDGTKHPNEGTKNGTTVQKTGTRALSPKPPLCSSRQFPPVHGAQITVRWLIDRTAPALYCQAMVARSEHQMMLINGEMDRKHDELQKPARKCKNSPYLLESFTWNAANLLQERPSKHKNKASRHDRDLTQWWASCKGPQDGCFGLEIWTSFFEFFGDFQGGALQTIWEFFRGCRLLWAS